MELDAEGLRLTFALKDAPRSLRSTLQVCAADPALGELYLRVSCRVRGGRTWVEAADGGPAFSRRDPVLVRGLRQAHRIAATLGWRMADGALSSLNENAPARAYQRKLCTLVFLAPDIQKAILAGRQPPGLTLEAILRADFPLDWVKQRRQLGFASIALPDPRPNIR